MEDKRDGYENMKRCLASAAECLVSPNEMCPTNELSMNQTSKPDQAECQTPTVVTGSYENSGSEPSTRGWSSWVWRSRSRTRQVRVKRVVKHNMSTGQKTFSNVLWWNSKLHSACGGNQERNARGELISAPTSLLPLRKGIVQHFIT